MPDYKRKKVGRTFHAAKRTKNDNTDIIMSSDRSNRKSKSYNNDIKVVRGNKLAKRQMYTVIFSAVAVVAAICILLSFILPGGLAENLLSTVKVLGAGSYPADISGASVVDINSKESYYYVLTDTNIDAYSNNGKKIFSLTHGFSNPILKTSNTRALVFDQGGKSASIYNLSGLIETVETEFAIINADINRSGVFGIVTHSDNYAAVVSVYNKNFKSIYTWSSAKDMVSHILINNKGNRLAVANINASSAQLVSKISILDFESADPLFSLDIGDSPVLALDNLGNGFSVITASEHRFINWSKHTTNSITSEGEINIFRDSKNGSLVVFNRANDRSDNTVIIVSKRGEKISEFKINDFISDIRYDNGRIYYVSDTNVNVLNKKGELLRSGKCGYGCVRFSVIAANSLAIATDNEIQRADIEKGE